MKNIGIMIITIVLVFSLGSTGFSTEETSLTEKYMEQQKELEKELADLEHWTTELRTSLKGIFTRSRKPWKQYHENIENIKNALSNVEARLKEIESDYVPEDQSISLSTGNSIKLFEAITPGPSKKAKPFNNLNISTTAWWDTPHILGGPKNISQQAKKKGMKVYLSGDAKGTKGWGIDNFLFIEIFLGSTVKRYVVGSVEEVSYQGVKVEHIGGNKFGFGPTEIELAQYIPDGSRFALTITALDYGGEKKLSDVWLVFKY
jgi:hypothetical protein